MKKDFNFFRWVKSGLIVLGVLLFILFIGLGSFYYGTKAVYHLIYKDMVKQTIKEIVKEESIKK